MLKILKNKNFTKHLNSWETFKNPVTISRLLLFHRVTLHADFYYTQKKNTLPLKRHVFFPFFLHYSYTCLVSITPGIFYE